MPATMQSSLHRLKWIHGMMSVSYTHLDVYKRQSLQSPYNRMNIGGIEVRLRQLGKRLGLNKVHPHKFRRTLATMAIDKGMPIEQLQQLLGHRRIDTTLQYAMVKQSNVKIAHRKYIG